MSILESTKLNQEVFKNIQITSQENMIIKSLEKFYEDDKNINLFIPILNNHIVNLPQIVLICSMFRK